jgi:4-amino-4-deoxy-L-arabinose transferase-like glycosyltransferase
MDFLLDVERVLLGMVGGTAIFMIAAVRPNLPKEGGERMAGEVWARFNVGAGAAVILVTVLAAVRLADGSDRALVHVAGGALLLAVLVLKSRLDTRMSQRTAAAGPGGPDPEAMSRDVTRVIPFVVATQVLSLVLALAPA